MRNKIKIKKEDKELIQLIKYIFNKIEEKYSLNDKKWVITRDWKKIEIYSEENGF